jgi:hypothetical protein
MGRPPFLFDYNIHWVEDSGETVASKYCKPIDRGQRMRSTFWSFLHSFGGAAEAKLE